MSKAAEDFIAANDKALVVSGQTHGVSGGKGATYTLENGKSFKLTAKECSEIGEAGYPKWKEIPQPLPEEPEE